MFSFNRLFFPIAIAFSSFLHVSSQGGRDKTERETRAMVSSSSFRLSDSFFRSSSATFTVNEKLRSTQQQKTQLKFDSRHRLRSSLFSSPSCSFLQKPPVAVVPIAAASLAIILWSNPANAGFLSGSTGIESVPGPQLPQIDFLSRFNEKNQKKYAEADAKFKESPLLKQLLEKSKLNKEKNKQEIQDKYCIRGAEWGVGDCSAEGMTVDERDKFISSLKEKAGIK